MEEFAIQFSIDDALQILDDSPIRPDIATQVTLVQVSNRVPVAHIAIERALKFLIRKNGREIDPHHNLHTHLRILRELDPSTVDFLDKAFDDATEFYGLNPNQPDLRHVKSIDSYLSTVGTADAFDRMRYWELDPEREEPLFRKVWPTIHREILLAIRLLFLPKRPVHDTVVVRVEQTVHDALFPTEKLHYSSGSGREASIKRYIDWVLKHTSRRAALTDAFRKDFAIGDQFMNEIVAQAYQDLTQSRDPAVRHLTSRIDVLPRQPRDVIPCVKWVGPETERAGRVFTPGGTSLGFIERSPDGIWHVTPLHEGTVNGSARVQSQTDARCYLAQILTEPCAATVNGKPSTLRLVGNNPYRYTRNYRRMSEPASAGNSVSWTHKLDCWDSNHGIAPNDQIRAEVPHIGGKPFVHVIEGRVAIAEDNELFVDGREYLDVADTA